MIFQVRKPNKMIFISAKNRKKYKNIIAKIFIKCRLIEPEIRPEYLQKLRKIDKNYSKSFSSINQLKKKIKKK